MSANETEQDDGELDQRVVEQILPAIDTLRSVETETEEQRETVDRAIELLENVMDDDRERHGASPTDKLAELVRSRDE